jgi:hypothetical protein
MVETEGVNRLVSVVVAAGALVVAALSLLVALAQSTIHYSLPSRDVITRHTSLYAPGVFAAVLAAVVVVAAGIWLVLAALGRSARWMMITVLALLVVDVVVLVVVSGLSRPSF